MKYRPSKLEPRQNGKLFQMYVKKKHGLQIIASHIDTGCTVKTRMVVTQLSQLCSAFAHEPTWKSKMNLTFPACSSSCNAGENISGAPHDKQDEEHDIGKPRIGKTRYNLKSVGHKWCY